MAFTFGQQSTTSQPSTFSFGGTTGAAPAQNTAVVAPFGSNPTSSAPTLGATGTSSLFGSTAAKPAGGLFGTGAPAASTTGTTGGLFGTTQPAAPAASTSAFSFNLNKPATTAATGLGLGATTSTTGGLFGAASTASTGGLFGQASGGLFGSGTATAGGSLFGAGGGLLGNKTTGNSLLNPVQPVASTATQFKGLGGTDIATTSDASSTDGGKSSQDLKLAKESNVPAELLQQIEQFKKYVAEEKKLRDEISKQASAKPLFQVQSDIVLLRNETVMVFTLIQRSLNFAVNLKEEYKQEMRNFEMITRVKETPVSLQDAGYSPIVYFLQKVQVFSELMVAIADQLRSIQNSIRNRQDLITTDEFIIGLKRINESFVALVGKYQNIQEKVAHLKTEYLLYRKKVLQDSTNIFDQNQKKSTTLNPAIFSASVFDSSRRTDGLSGAGAPICTVGPSNFLDTTTTVTASGNAPTLGQTTGFSGFSSTLSGGPALASTSLFSSSSLSNGFSLGSSALAPAPSSLLATPKPALGTKRNKSK